MVGTRGFERLVGRQAARWGVLSLAGVLVCACCGCTRKGSESSAIRREYAKGKYEEAIALCDRAVRNNSAGGDVYYYYGLSLLAEGRDVEAFKRLEEAVSADSARASDASGELVGRAMDSIARGMAHRAAQLVREAADLDAELTVGPLGYLVADSYYEDKKWEDAASCYTRALREYPDTSAAERGYFNLAACQSTAGDSTAAIETLETQLSKFPRGPLASQARWGLSDLLYGRARSEFDRGNYDVAAGLVTRMPRWEEDTALVQQARFLQGECYERTGDFAKAYEVFKTIVEDSPGGSGRMVERARAKMKAFHDAGLH
jgi:tetratricopeptide (TPR) repeat protein